MSILFHSLLSGRSIPHKSQVKYWLIKIISDNGKKIGDLNIIFVDDKKLVEINQKYLNHNYLTDTITFNYNEGTIISGDIYISFERVKENAKKFNCSFTSEMLRVIVHGVFHLLGFNDKTKIQKAHMRQLEENALLKFTDPGNP